jgi:hypothetical protein
LNGTTARSWSESLGLPIFSRPAETASLFDGDNFDFATIQLYGLTNPISDKQAGKRGHIRYRSAAGIRLVFAYDPERLAAVIVAEDRDMAAERDHDSVTRFRLWHCARDPLREIAHIPRSQFQGATTLVSVLYHLPGFERLLTVGEGALEPMEAGLGHKVGMCRNRSRRQGHFLCGLGAFLPDKRNAHCRHSFKGDIYVAFEALLSPAIRSASSEGSDANWRAATAA